MTNTSDTPPNKLGSRTAISLYAAEALTGCSRRTLWRKVASGILPRGPDDTQGRATVPWTALSPWLKLPLNERMEALVQQADAGAVSAQAELGEILLQAGEASCAVYWFQLAAKQGAADALHWLALCAFNGWGRPADANQGMIWLARAAALGHPVAHAQMAGLQPGT